MNIAGQRRQKLYKLLQNSYQKKLKIKFEWKTGEKSRWAANFIKFADLAGFEETKDFDKALEYYSRYVETMIDAWLGWDNRARYNLIGFLGNKDTLAMYASDVREYGSGPKKTKLEGMQTEDEWGF